MTPTEIRARCDSEHFFSRATMRFFGDTMRSYGTRTVDGQLYMYRKPSARVNVFGRSTMAGREFFGAWRVTENNDGTVSLDRANDLEKSKVYRAVTGHD
jgi:hypothetical protein